MQCCVHLPVENWHTLNGRGEGSHGRNEDSVFPFGTRAHIQGGVSCPNALSSGWVSVLPSPQWSCSHTVRSNHFSKGDMFRGYDYRLTSKVACAWTFSFCNWSPLDFRVCFTVWVLIHAFSSYPCLHDEARMWLVLCLDRKMVTYAKLSQKNWKKRKESPEIYQGMN